MRAMMFDVMKSRTKFRALDAECPRQDLREITNLRRVSETILDLIEKSFAIAIADRERSAGSPSRDPAWGARHPVCILIECGYRCRVLLPSACLPPPASCFLPSLCLCDSVAKLLRCKQNLLMQMRGRVARNANVIDLFNSDSSGAQTIANGFRRKAGA